MTAFIHRPYQKGETIAAIATPPGEGGVAIIRISGDRAIDIAAQVYKGPLRSYVSHTLHVGTLISRQGEKLDQAMCVVMKGPRSYTGEDTVEFHCHGGSWITQRVLEAVLEAGARAALPGEFTFKAFMNGKIDLAQAEAVQSLIGAKSELAMKASKHQLEGALSKKIASFQKEIIDVAAILEAWVDFPEEGLEFSSLEEIQKTLSSILQKMEQFRETFKEGKILHEGLTLALCGAPNVGKSSLMNALLGKNRAIVTDIAGTTRDILEEDLRLGGIHFKLVDTAGIRESNEIVEKEGIRRSRQMLEEADLVLIVLDSTRALAHEEKEILNQTQCLKRVLIWNKADLPSDLAPPPEAVVISAKKGEGLDLLKKTIIHSIFSGKPLSKEEVVITNARHHQALGEAISYLTKVNQGLFSGVSPEFLSADIRASLQELGSIIGQDISEEILTAIFSKFCVGK